MTTATHTFLSWVREGLATALGPAGPDQTGRAALSVGVTLNTGAVEVAGLHLLGPGDVTGIDRSQVLRTDPPHLAGSCEADHFAAVEFDQPSLPWLLTPGREDASGRLRPWMCLVVVRKQDGVTIAADPLHAVTVLRVAPPAAVGDELPDLADSWAWAHAQVAGPAADPAAAVRDAPDRCLSRLLCPRPLQPSTPYLACVVPTFAAGRAAGLGEPAPVAPASPVDPAWLQTDTGVRLPVYYSWEFVTGPAGDFSALARRLRGQPAPDGAAELVVDAWAADADPPGPQDLLRGGGALRRPGGVTSPLPSGVKIRLATLLAGTGTTAGPVPELRMPVYGGPQAGETSVPATGTGWLAELNLDPRNRAAAAAGARVVQELQDELVAAAWQQAGEAGEAGRLVSRAQLAAEANTSLVDRHLQPLEPQQFLAVTAPLHGRIQLSPVTLQTLVSASAIPDATLSPAYRRLTRPRGPLARRLSLRDGPEPPAAAGLVGGTGPAAEIEPGIGADGAAPTLPAVLDAALRLLAPPAVGSSLAEAPPPPLSPGEAKDALLARLDPPARIADRLDARIAGPAPTGDTSAAPLWRRTVTPRFATPMYDALARLSLDAVLPGADRLPPDSVVLLETNPTFVAAFLAGLNGEMSRELMWRGYPVDPTETFFRSFWDFRGHAGTPGPDIPPVSEWPASASLDQVVSTPGGAHQLVLAVRGELLRRHPRTAVYAVRAAWAGQGPGRTLAEGTTTTASFSGFIPPDVRFFGFDLGADQARGTATDPGWFFVFQQQATEARFGPAGTGPPDLTGRSSAQVAALTLKPTVRVALHADALLPEPASAS